MLGPRHRECGRGRAFKVQFASFLPLPPILGSPDPDSLGGIPRQINSTNWLNKPRLSGQSWGPVSLRLGKAGFMAYCSPAHRVGVDRVRTLIGLTALSGLTAQRDGGGSWAEGMKTQVGVQPPASFMSDQRICVFSQGSICLCTGPSLWDPLMQPVWWYQG